MTLAAPNLDDRRFQELVDEAKRMVQKRCPEWSDHNVSDPGVTLIETFAYMVDQLLYRLNRVPDRMYLEFLNLLGVELFPPTAARTAVTFWLSAPQPQLIHVPEGTTVATLRTETDEAVAFTTVEDLRIVPTSIRWIRSSIHKGRIRDHTDHFGLAGPFQAFDRQPQPGDALLIGLTEAVPSCAVLIDIDCKTEGVGVDPKHPPLVWEAFNGSGWSACTVERDSTGGLNRAGEVLIHVPETHTPSSIRDAEAGWLRCRVLRAERGQPAYIESPRIARLAAATLGATAPAVNAEIVHGEILGVSQGVPGQRFRLRRRPVVPAGEPPVLEVSSEEGWEPWEAVETFAGGSEARKIFGLDAIAGEVVLAPAVREPNGTLRAFGAIPPNGATLRLRSYRTGGGLKGNVGPNTITVLKSSIPFVSRVQNRAAATGGVDAEDLASAKIRGPLELVSRDRAVTLADYEHLTRQAAPEIARVRCLTAGAGADAGSVRLLVVPDIPPTDSGSLPYEDIVPDDEVLAAIAAYLEPRRCIGARVSVEPPTYQGITVVARVRARQLVAADTLSRACQEALYRYLNPVTGGPDGDGWPFGRTVQRGEIYSVLQRVPGTDFVEEIKLFPADPATGEREPATERVELNDDSLVFSYEHQIRVEEAS